MKTFKFKWLLIVTGTWALLPWLLWLVYQFHKPDHADVFWLLALPFTFISFLPMFLSQGGDAPMWFPMGWVIGSSAFNLVLGTAFFLAVSLLTKKRDV